MGIDAGVWKFVFDQNELILITIIGAASSNFSCTYPVSSETECTSGASVAAGTYTVEFRSPGQWTTLPKIITFKVGDIDYCGECAGQLKPEIVQSTAFSSLYPASSVLILGEVDAPLANGEANFWLAEEGKTTGQGFTLKVDSCTRLIAGCQIKNKGKEFISGVWNNWWSTKEFRVSGSMNENGPWETLLEGQLNDTTFAGAHIPASLLNFTFEHHAEIQFLKFDLISFWGSAAGGGLQYFAAIPASNNDSSDEGHGGKPNCGFTIFNPSHSSQFFSISNFQTIDSGIWKFVFDQNELIEITIVGAASSLFSCVYPTKTECRSDVSVPAGTYTVEFRSPKQFNWTTLPKIITFKVGDIDYCGGEDSNNTMGNIWNKEYDEPQFTQEPRSGGKYERRTYPPSSWVCTNLTVDTAADPLAGQENVPFLELMKTETYQENVPSSKMYWLLRKYILGANEGNITIEMTKGVTTKHVLENENENGETELQEMCFYLENKFQETLNYSGAVPLPTDPKVYIRKRDELIVSVKQFGGWAFTADTWMKNRDNFENFDLDLDLDPRVEGVYYTKVLSHPWVPESERVNEIWFEAVDA